MQAKVDVNAEGRGKDFNFGLKWERGDVVYLSPNASIQEAAALMKEHQIGTVLIINNEAGRDVEGIVTDRDIALCLADDINFENRSVADIMSKTVVSAYDKDDILKLISLMRDHGVSRLPMKNASGRVVGVVTSKNLLEILLRALFDITQISEQQRKKEQTH